MSEKLPNDLYAPRGKVLFLPLKKPFRFFVQDFLLMLLGLMMGACIAISDTVSNFHSKSFWAFLILSAIQICFGIIYFKKILQWKRWLALFFSILTFLIVAYPIGWVMSGMFKPHTYNWKTGMPSLEDQVTSFQQMNKRWPNDYNELAFYMKQITTNFIPESYDRIDFITKPDGNLEIDVYTFSTRTTNRIILKQ
jgi:hypothetical protein